MDLPDAEKTLLAKVMRRILSLTTTHCPIPHSSCQLYFTAQAIANEANSNFISVKGPELLNKVKLLDMERR